MIKGNSSLKNLTGGGFDFEDHVGAYFISLLLSGVNFSEELGPVIRIEFQKRSKGIQLDDYLITFSAHGVTSRLFLSVKSYQLITTKGANSEFVEACWIDFSNSNGSGFDPNSDFLGLACSSMESKIKDSTDELINLAKGQESKNLKVHIHTPDSTSDITRAIFSSFSCPLKLGTEFGLTDDDTGILLRRLLVIPFDFENNPSDKEILAIERCQRALTSGLPDEASVLWEEVLRISNWLSSKGGYIDSSRLIKFLKNKFSLLGLYEDMQDWIHIKSQTFQHLQTIPDKIGGIITLKRKIIENINLNPNQKFIFLIGETGSGKTVVAKHWAETQINSGTVIWINGFWLNNDNPNSYGKRLSLTHDLAELLSRSPEQNGWIIIDSIEKIKEQEISELFRIVNSLDIFSNKCTWHVIITCNSEAWGRINTNFIKSGFNSQSWIEKEITIFSDENISELEELFPHFKVILKNTALKALVYRPKVLDLLALQSVDISHWIGESDLIHWYWESEIIESEKGYAKNSILLKMGEYEADNWISGVLLSDLPTSDNVIIQQMTAQNLCRRESQRIFFFHDILSDWARLQLITGHEDDLVQYLNHRIDSPLWDKSIRLFGLHILEFQKNIEKWRYFFEIFKVDGTEYSKINNLLLESIIFSLKPLPILESLMPELEKDNGLLLNRLLIQFLQVATKPNPLVLTMCRHIGINETIGSLYNRIPLWEYWGRFIPFFLKYQEKIADITPKCLLDIAEKYLTFTKPSNRYRTDFASIVLTIAESIKEKNSGYYRDKELAKLAYSTALLAIYEEPDRIRRLVLGLSGKNVRLTPQITIIENEVDSRIYGKYIQKKLPPWEYGPYSRVDSVFKKICLEGLPLLQLIQSYPELAKEIILSNIIEEPKVIDPYDSDCLNDTKYGLSSDLYVKSALFDNGPFLLFLRINPIEGLDLIIKLIDFSTGQWMKNKKDISDDNDKVTQISLLLSSGIKTFKGDHCVYYWFRDTVINFTPPPIITCALMALEKFLYEQIDEKLPIDQYIQYIYDHSESVAFFGLLSSVGKYHPILFTEPLKLLFSVPEFHLWEMTYNAQSNVSFNPFGIMESKETQKKIKSWNSMEHRVIDLHTISINYYLRYPQLNSIFEQFIPIWEERTQNPDDPLDSFFIKGTIEHYKRENYFKVEKAGKTVLEYKEPLELTKMRERFEISDENLAFTINISTFPDYCLKILIEHITLQEEELNKIWDFLDECQTSKSEIFADHVISLEDVVSGGIAVLYINHRDWLERNPDRKEWCTNTIHNIIINPPKPTRFDNPESIVIWRWDCFCARIIPYIWVEKIENEDIRSDILKLVLNPHYNTLGFLLQSCFELRSSLKENFYSLIHVSIIWSFVRKWLEFNNELSSEHEYEYIKWIDGIFEAFLNQQLSPEIPQLLELAQINQDLQEKESNSIRIPQRFTKYDLQAFQSCFTWIPTLSQAESQCERQSWIAIVKNLSKFLVFDIENRIEYLKEYQYPHDVHNWFFQIQARIICEMNPNEFSSEIWKPILALPGDSDDFIESFFTYLFIYLNEYQEHPSNFISSWKGMIDYALSLQSWDYCMNKAQDLDKRWCNLIGIMTVPSDRWNTGLIEIVNAMKDYYQNWSSHNLTRFYCLKQFTVFLTNPACSEIRIISLIWLKEFGIDQIRDQFWGDKEQNEKLAELLNVCWNNQYYKLVGNKQAFECFKLILQKLSELQVPLAIELNHRISEKPV